jgi:hypothetical protein
MTIDCRRPTGSNLALVLVLVLALAALSVSCRPPRPRPDGAHADGQAAARDEEEEGSPPASGSAARLVVKSPAFEAGGAYPAKFTCDGASASPPVEWSGAPEGTKCYALNVWHIPGPGDVKSYWVVSNIPANVTSLPRNATNIGVDGINDGGGPGMTPCAPRGQDPRPITSRSTPCRPSWSPRAAGGTGPNSWQRSRAPSSRGGP